MRPRQKAITVMVLLSALTLIASGQERTQQRDTSANRMHRAERESTVVKSPVLLPLSLGVSPKILADFFHQTPVLGMPLFLTASQEKIDLVAPWNLAVEKQEELRTLRTILGSIGAGGAAYAAYEHIKKYGLK